MCSTVKKIAFFKKTIIVKPLQGIHNDNKRTGSESRRKAQSSKTDSNSTKNKLKSSNNSKSSESRAPSVFSEPSE